MHALFFVIGTTTKSYSVINLYILQFARMSKSEFHLWFQIHLLTNVHGLLNLRPTKMVRGKNNNFTCQEIIFQTSNMTGLVVPHKNQGNFLTTRGKGSLSLPNTNYLILIH